MFGTVLKWATPQVSQKQLGRRTLCYALKTLKVLMLFNSNCITCRNVVSSGLSLQQYDTLSSQVASGLRMLEYELEGNMISRNVGKDRSNDTAPHSHATRSRTGASSMAV